MAKKKVTVIFPAKLKFKKFSKHLSNLKTAPFAFKSTNPRFGRFAIQALHSCLINRNQLEAVRIALRRPIKSIPGSKVWVLHKPSVIMTKRSSETRMGRGKGLPHSQVVNLKAGQLIYEITGPCFAKMQTIFIKAAKKLPVPTQLINVSYGSFI